MTDDTRSEVTRLIAKLRKITKKVEDNRNQLADAVRQQGAKHVKSGNT